MKDDEMGGQVAACMREGRGGET